MAVALAIFGPASVAASVDGGGHRGVALPKLAVRKVDSRRWTSEVVARNRIRPREERKTVPERGHRDVLIGARVGKIR